MLAIRQISLLSPSLPPPDTLIFRRLTAHEGLSRLFEYQVELMCDSHILDLDKVLGEEMCIALDLPLNQKRFFHGYVASFGQVETEGEKAVYKAVVRPHLWKLSRTADCRVFQKERVPDIVEGILKKHGIQFESNLGGGDRGDYLPWEYCVQYRETDLAFISRLLEHEGIHYFFKHAKDKHTMVLTDSLGGHATVPSYEEVEYRRTPGGRREERLWDWRVNRTVLPGSYALSDYDFLDPTADLLRASGSAVERKHKKGASPDYEIFDHPEPVVQQEGYEAQLLEDLAKVRIGELHAQYETITVRTDARGLHPGALFKVKEHPRPKDASVEYLIIKAEFELYMDELRAGGKGSDQPVYEATLSVINSKNGFRPQRTTPKPVIQGMQSATVVGPSGEKVWTDKHGRVKVLFHWDRENKVDESKAHEKSSCWVRVSQAWAGANWGGMFLPHVGQEVLVGFLEGDPDRPVVVGRVYNKNNMPPLTLPDNKLKSIIRDNFGNEIVLDGTPGKEHMSFHSPHHHSVLQLGRSAKTFTHSVNASRTIDSESYHLGKKFSFTKGVSVSLDRGAWVSAKMGAGASLTLASEVSASAGIKFSFVAGGTYSLNAAWSFAWGASSEFKFTKGAYKRSSGSNVWVDSQATVFLSGGKNDNTLLISNDDELALSFDKSKSDREAALKKADRAAKARAVIVGGALATMGGLSAWQYQSSVPDVGPIKDPHAKTQDIDTEFERFSLSAAGDGLSAVALIGTILKGIEGYPEAIEDPKHPNPQAKITIKEDVVEMFAGQEKEAKIFLQKSGGINVEASKGVVIGSNEEAVDVTAKKAITLKSDDAVVVDCKLKHRNFEVLP